MREPLNEEEQQKLLGQFDTRYPNSTRNRAFVKLLLWAGLKPTEALDLLWEDLEMRDSKLSVGAGPSVQGKPRKLWLNKATIEALRKWKEHLKETGTHSRYIFALVTPTKNKKVQERQMRNSVNRYGKKAGIRRNVSPATLRDTCGCRLYRESGDLELVQKALGYKSLSGTKRYKEMVSEGEAKKNRRRCQDKNLKENLEDPYRILKYYGDGPIQTRLV